MSRHADYLPHGVIPAVLLPFDDDLAIDESELPQASARRGGDRRHFGHHHQRAFDGGRLLQLRRAAARARHRAGRDRRPAAARQRRLGRRQPRSRAHRPHGGGGRRLGAAGVSAGAVHARPIAGHGDRAFQAHRRRQRPADHRLPVSARHRPGLSARHAPEDVEEVPTIRAIKDWSGNVPQHEMHIRDAAEPAAAGERALDPQRLAVLLARARLQRPPLGQRQRDPRPAGRHCSRRCKANDLGDRAGGSTTASIRLRACSTPSRGSTCTTA